MKIINKTLLTTAILFIIACSNTSGKPSSISSSSKNNQKQTDNLPINKLIERYRLGNHELFNQFKVFADKDNTEGQFYIGRMYHLGHGVQENKQKAIEYYRKAAKKNHPIALGNLASLLHDDHKYKEAKRLYKKSIKLGGIYSPLRYVSQYLCKKPGKASFSKMESLIGLSIKRTLASKYHSIGNNIFFYPRNCLKSNYKKEIDRYIKWLFIAKTVKGLEKGQSFSEMYELNLEGGFFYDLYDTYLYLYINKYKKSKVKNSIKYERSQESYFKAIVSGIEWLYKEKIITKEQLNKFPLRRIGG